MTKKVTIDPTRPTTPEKLDDRRRGVVQWIFAPSPYPIANLIVGIVLLTTLSLILHGWYQVLLAPVIGYFIFMLGVAVERRKKV